jgi:hypothetical protein
MLPASVSASAEARIDIGLLLGRRQRTDAGSVLQVKRGTTHQPTLAWHVWSGNQIGISIDMTFLASPAFDLNTQGDFQPTVDAEFDRGGFV